MNFFSGMLADVATPVAAQSQSPAGLPGLLNNPLTMMVLMGVIFYFILIRPQQQRAKQQRKLLEALKAGDRVVTAAGIVGVVTAVKDKAMPPSVSLRSADAKFEVTKASVTEILSADATTTVS